MGELKYNYNSKLKQQKDYLGFFVKGIMVDILDPLENQELVLKLDEYQEKMQDEFKINTSLNSNRNMANILGATLNTLYNRKIYTPETRGFLNNGLADREVQPHANQSRNNPNGFRILNNRVSNRRALSNQSRRQHAESSNNVIVPKRPADTLDDLKRGFDRQ